MSGFLLDTNVPSEAMRAMADTSVAAWLKSRTKESQFLSVVTMGGLRKGVTILSPGARRTQIEQSIEFSFPRGCRAHSTGNASHR